MGNSAIIFGDSNIWPAIAGSVAASVALPLLMRVFRKLAPYKPPPEESPVLSPEQRKYLGKWCVIIGLTFFLFWPVFFFLWFKITQSLHVFVHSSLGSSAFIIFPLGQGLIVTSLFLGLVTSIYATHYFFRLVLRDRFTKLLHYDQICSGMDGRINGWIVLAIGVLSVCFTFLALSCYIRFLEDSLVIKPFGAFSKQEYRYSEIAEIRQISAFRAPIGTIVGKPHYQLVFSDGCIWSTRGDLREPDPQIDDDVMKFVSEKSGKPFVHYELPPE
jgi:hypothetical protein